MKKKLTHVRWLAAMLLLVAAMVVPSTAWAEITPSKPQNGDGKANSPYQIGTPEELYWFAALVNGTLTDGTNKNPSACAVLVKDITVNENLLSSKLDENGEPRENVNIESWTPIGYYKSSSDYVHYKGTFDGQGHSISGLYCKQSETINVSFCGLIEDGTIKNIAILDSYFEGNTQVGGILGVSSGSNIILNCLFSGTVKGIDYVGGISGACYASTLFSDSFCNANIVSSGSNIGGICGASVYASTQLVNCVYNSNLFTGNAITWGDANQIGTQVNVTGMTTDEIASGKATHWLNRYHSGDGLGWYQNIDNGQNDAYPVLDNTHGVVYTSQPCPSSGKFSNNKSSLTELDHSWENNVCTQCGKTKDVFDLVEGFEEPLQVSGVYQISAAGELYWFTALVNGLLTDGTHPNRAANAVLTSDITVNSNVLDESGNLAETSKTHLDWVPIGNSDRPYAGTFNGQGYAIYGLYVEKSEDYIGLFGYSSGTIKNTSVAASYIKGNKYVGGLCGCAGSATIENCHNSSYVYGSSYVGGLCGYMPLSAVVQSGSNTGIIESTGSYIGGIVGYSNGAIANCFNEGTIKSTATGIYIGGISGYNESSITNSYNVGTIVAPNGETNIGAICGRLSFTSSQINNCYYSPIDGIKPVGGYGSSATESQVINVSSKTADEFKSGEVAYLLNNSVSDGTQRWYQYLAAEGGDAYPVLKSTGDNTVYKGYRHNETTLLYLNNQVHAHAYDSSASDEPSGNHDMSCVQNGQNPYTWKDTENKTNATAKCNFTCTVCNSELAKDMTVTSDNENTNVPVTCVDDGFNYYKATLTFNGNSYDDWYTQNVPKLGHDMPVNASLNSELQIYQKGCKREGCRYADYYATSDGNVVANITESGFVANALTLEDAKKYDNQAVFTATNFTYTRTFSNTNWTTWYVPFELTLTKDICDKFAFSRINNVHQYDDNGDGNADRTVVESFRQNAGVKLKANYPYLVRAKNEDYYEMSLPLTNVVPALAETNSIDCQSVDYKYTFTGTYATMGDSGSDKYTLSTSGSWKHFLSLKPMRHYLTITSRNATSNQAAPMHVLLSVIGEEDTTGIVKLYDEERKATETYDLSGRRLPAGSKQRGLIIENGKVTFKK